jgi:hypothetical protein
MAGRANSPQCLPSRATEVGFQKGLFLWDCSGVGISPGKVSASGGERKTACDGKALAPILDDGGGGAPRGTINMAFIKRASHSVGKLVV